MNETLIGRVVAVDTTYVTIELAPDLKAMARTTYEGVHEVGRINSYVTIAVGARRLVGMVTRVVLTDEAEMVSDRTMVSLPKARRLMKATLIGTVAGSSYTQGVSTFPVLDSPVHLVSRDDLDVIFDRPAGATGLGGESRFGLRLGDSAIFDGFPIQIDPDTLFGKHVAVLGSTGSGKSCTIAAVIQGILEQQAVQHTHFVILDTNGEYRSAFQRKAGGAWADATTGACLYIPSDSSRASERLVIPYWFLNGEDYLRVFRAREGVQGPVLLRALRLARGAAKGNDDAVILDTFRTSCQQMLATLSNDAPSQQWAIPSNLHGACSDGLRFREQLVDHVAVLARCGKMEALERFEQGLTRVKQIVLEVFNPNEGRARAGQAIGATRAQQIRQELEGVIEYLGGAALDATPLNAVGADQPAFFSRSQFLTESLDLAMREQAEKSNPGRVREACGPMLLRIRRFLEDPRFAFLFDEYPNAPSVLAAFVRTILGVWSTERPMDQKYRGSMPFYDTDQSGSSGHDVIIVDLSLLASEVLENVAALIGRLVLEFLQRLGDEDSGQRRGTLPVVMVLEEAQNYIRDRRSGEEDSISKVVFERIAREGRKYGLGLVVASQRPSELSKTVLSQCSSFVVHRLQNPEDLRYIRDIVPSVYEGLTGQLSALAPQTALVMGECVRAPALVRIRDARPVPRSPNPRFVEHWLAAERDDAPVDVVCKKWEAGTSVLPVAPEPEREETERSDGLDPTPMPQQ